MLNDDLATGTAARVGDAALALLLALLLTLSGIGAHALWTPDEPRDAAIGLAMARSGDVITPRLNGRPFLEKPPLYWWAEAALDHALRIDAMPLGDWRRDAVSRLPSAIFGALSLLVAFQLGRRLGGRRGGFLALGVLASMVEFGEVAGRAIVDPAVVFAVSLGHLGLVHWHGARSGEGGEHRRGALLVAISLPLSFLAKGIVGPGLVLGPGILYLAVTRQWRALLGAWPIAALGTASLAALAAPYILMLHREGGNDALYELLVKNVLGRLLRSENGVLGHTQPPWYYLLVGPATIAPWVVALPALLAAGALRKTFEGASEPRRLLLATFLFGLVMLSIPSTKRELYLTPLFPALAAVVAWWLATASPARRWDRPTLVLLLVVAALAPLLGVAALLGLQHAQEIMPHVPLAALKKLPLGPVAALVTTPVIGLAGALAALWSGFLLVRLARGARHGSLPGPGLVVVAWVVVMLVYQSGVKALIDPLKSMHPLMAAVAREIPGPGPVVVWDPNETIQGIIEFDLSRPTDCRWPSGGSDPSGDFGALLRAGKVKRFLTDVKDLAKLDPSIRAGLRTVYSNEGEVASPHQIVEWVGSEEEASMIRRAALCVAVSIAAACLAPPATADGPLSPEATALAKALKDGVPAALLVDPSPASITKTAAGERLLAFAKWAAELEAGPLVHDGKLVPGRAESAAPYVAAGMKTTEGGLAILDYQGGLVTVIPPSEGPSTWKHALDKAVARASAVGDAKKKRVKEIERDEATIQADLKAGDSASAIKLGLPIEADTSVRCEALDRVKKTLEDLHEKGMGMIKAIDDEKDRAQHPQGGASHSQAMRDWANHTIASVRQIRKLYGPFKDVNDAASDREALATRTLQGQ